MDAIALIWQIGYAVVAFAAAWALSVWRGTSKGHADYVYETLGSTTALRNFLKGEVARKGGLDGVAKGVKIEEPLNAVVDDMFSRLETMRMGSMATEYIFYALLVAVAVGGAYAAPLVGIPVCLLTIKQAVKDKGQPLGVQTVLRLFGIFHAWLKDSPVEAINYSKTQKFAVKNITDLLRESRAYAI